MFSDAPNLNLSNSIKLDPAPAADNRTKLGWEKELLGLYVSEHPFNEFREHLKDVITPISDLEIGKKNDNVLISGVITDIKKIITKTNESMLFVKIEDSASNVEVLVFPRLLKETGGVWQEGKVVICAGKVSDKDQEIKILANQAKELILENIANTLKSFQVRINNASQREPVVPDAKKPAKKTPAASSKPLGLLFHKNLDEEEMNKLKEIILKNTGPSKVYFTIKQNVQDNIIETGFRVNNNEKLIKEIKDKLGDYLEVFVDKD